MSVKASPKAAEFIIGKTASPLLTTIHKPHTPKPNICAGNDITYTYKYALSDKKEKLPELSAKQKAEKYIEKVYNSKTKFDDWKVTTKDDDFAGVYTLSVFANWKSYELYPSWDW